MFNSGLAGIDQADLILLIGTNPRWEASLVNTRILRAVNERRIKVGVLGPMADFGYPVEHVGNNPRDIEQLVTGTGGFAERLRAAKNPMMIVGSGAYARADGAAVQALVYDLCTKYNVIRDDWNGYNLLNRAASRVGALEVGFTPRNHGYDFQGILDATRGGMIRALYLLGADEFDARGRIGWQTFVIYQGHHGDAGAARADVILPGAAYTEKDGIYVNTEGRPQLSKRAGFPPGDAREDWKILRALSEQMGHALSYDTDVELRARIGRQWPHLVDFDAVKRAQIVPFGQPGPVSTDQFVLPVTDFYQTNAICRASKTMRACSQAFLNSTHIAEAAE
jgi:NADH-quinone oxidoreductase subunit G